MPLYLTFTTAKVKIKLLPYFFSEFPWLWIWFFLPWLVLKGCWLESFEKGTIFVKHLMQNHSALTILINSGNHFSQLHFRIKHMHKLSSNFLIKHYFQVTMHFSIDKFHSFNIFYILHCQHDPPLTFKIWKY